MTFLTPRPGAELRQWMIFRPGWETRRAATLELARQHANATWPAGFVRVEHETTGESWVREKGGWRQDKGGQAGHLLPDEVA